MNTTYAQRLQKCMDDKRVDRKELAKGLDCTVQAIGAVLTSTIDRRLSMHLHLKAADYLGVDSAWLQTGQLSNSMSKTIALQGHQLDRIFNLLPNDEAIRAIAFAEATMAIMKYVKAK